MMQGSLLLIEMPRGPVVRNRISQPRRKRCREIPHPLIEKAGIRAASESSNTHEETGATSKSCISLTKLGVGKLTYRILNMMDLDGRGESAHATRTFLLQFPLRGFSHAEIKIAHCSGSDHGIDSSPQSNSSRHLRSDMHRCRPLPCLQEL